MQRATGGSLLSLCVYYWLCGGTWLSHSHGLAAVAGESKAAEMVLASLCHARPSPPGRFKSAVLAKLCPLSPYTCGHHHHDHAWLLFRDTRSGLLLCALHTIV